MKAWKKIFPPLPYNIHGMWEKESFSANVETSSCNEMEECSIDQTSYDSVKKNTPKGNIREQDVSK